MSRREVRGDLDAVCLDVGNGGADEARHLARMRSDDQIALFAAGQPSRIVGQHGQRIGIQDQRDRGPIEQRANELRDLRRATKAGSAGDDVVGLLQQLFDASRRQRSAESSGRSTVMNTGDIAARTGRQHRGVATVTSPAPDRNAPSAARCAAPVFPTEPATIVSRPKSPLCESAARGPTDAAQLLGCEQLDVWALEAFDDFVRNADVGDDDVAGIGLARRQARAAALAQRA